MFSSVGTRAGILRVQKRVSLRSEPGAARALSLCLSSPSSRSSPSPAATGFYLHCSLKPGSQCAARPSIRSRSQQLPLKLQRIITTSCSRLLAGRPALQTSILIPRVTGRQQPALGSSEFSEGSAHTLGRKGNSPSLSWLPEASACLVSSLLCQSGFYC